MNKETYIRTLIKNSGNNIKSFAEKIGLPYTTLTGILTRGIDGASVQNVMKICKALKITVEDLQKVETLNLNEENTGDTKSSDLVNRLGEKYNLRNDELLIVKNYIQMPEQDRKVFTTFLKSLISNDSENRHIETTTKTDEHLSIDERLALIRPQLEAAEKGKTSTVSTSTNLPAKENNA